MIIFEIFAREFDWSRKGRGNSWYWWLCRGESRR